LPTALSGESEAVYTLGHMTASAGSEPNDAASQTPLFQDARFQALAVPASVQTLLRTIEQCRNIAGYSRSQESNGADSRSELGLKASERRTLDRSIDALWVDVEIQALAEVKKLGLVGDDVRPDDLIYPLGEEAALTLEDALLQKIKEEAIRAHLGDYQNNEIYAAYTASKLRLGPPRARASMIGAALLPFVVGKMEQFISGLVRTGLSLYPKGLGALPSVPPEIVQQYGRNVDSSDLLRWMVDQKIDRLISGTPNEWAEKLERWPGLDLATVGGDWESIKELVQRRHVIVHNSGRADDEYLSRVPDRFKHGIYIGAELNCGATYFDAALIELETWAMCLTIHWGRKIFGSNATYPLDAVSRLVDLESRNRWIQALAIANALLMEPQPANQETVGLARINRWFCLQQIGQGDDALANEIRSWRMPELDDPYTTFRVTAAKAALLRDYDELAKMLRQAASNQNLPYQKQVFREMPLMRRAIGESRAVASALAGPEVRRVRTQSSSSRRARNRG
jgi:hypothetical protein